MSGNRFSPGVPSRVSQWGTHPYSSSFSESPAYLLMMSSLRQDGVVRCSPFTSTTSLVIPVTGSWCLSPERPLREFQGTPKKPISGAISYDGQRREAPHDIDSCMRVSDNQKFVMRSVVLLLPVVIVTERCTDWPCTLDMCNTTTSFIHGSNVCVIRRLAFLNLGFIDLMSCTPLPVTLRNLASQNSGLSTNLKILWCRSAFGKLGLFQLEYEKWFSQNKLGQAKWEY